MKLNKIALFQWGLLLPLVSFFSYAGAQSKLKGQGSIDSLIQSKNYIFVAQTVLPMRGGTRQLTSYYNLTVANDSLVAALPYFGRAYTAPIDPSEGGINFTSTKFDYNASHNKKGDWDISMKPNDQPDGTRFSLHVSSKGYASLQVVSNNRQPISFNGILTSRTK